MTLCGTAGAPTITLVTAIHDSGTPPDTRALVRKAASELTAEGRKVSVRSIRAHLGNRGSTTTISDALRSWREDERAAQTGRRNATMDSETSQLPAGLAREAQLLYLRVLAHVGVQFSNRRAADALQVVDAAEQQKALLEQLGRVSDFAAGTSTDLTRALEEQARLAALLQERDALVQGLQTQLAEAVARTQALGLELSAAKLAAAEREALALARVDGLNKHLMRVTEEQRAQIVAPLNALKERHESLQTREAVLMQQVSGLREEVARLQGRLQERGS